MVNGPYFEARKATRLRPPSAIFCDDGTFVISDSSTPQYSVGSWPTTNIDSTGLVTAGGAISGLITTELYLKFSKPVTEIAGLVFALEDVRFNLTTSGATSAAPIGSLHMNLIKVPLDSGPFALPVLTGVQGIWRGGNGPHGTLYDTASNFDSFGGAGLPILTAGSSKGLLLNVVFNLGGSGVNTIGVSFSGAGGGGAVKTDGPYYGAHLFWTSPSNALIVPSGGSCAWNYVVDEIPNPRTAGSLLRSYAVGSSFFSG